MRRRWKLRAGAGALAAGAAAGSVATVGGRALWRARARRGAARALTLGVRGVDDLGSALLQATGAALTDGNRIALRADASVFDALRGAMESARHSIHVELFIWKADPLGRDFAAIAARRARRGVAVRILVDPIGSPGFDEELAAPLRAAGCAVQYFRPPRRHPLAITGRNHRKQVVIDGRLGFTGGFGIASEWRGGRDGAPQWRDTNVEIEGPAVVQMQAAFAAHWLETGGRLLPIDEFRRARTSGGARAAYVTSMDVIGPSHARWLTQVALGSARRRAWISNAYFAPPPQIFGALGALPRRGVDARVLLPGPHQDHPTVTWIQRRLYGPLARRGVRMYEYQPSMMHAKTMLVDDRIAIVGSINLDYLSMEWLEEGCLVADDRPFAAELERLWLADVARARFVAGPNERAGLPRPRAVSVAARDGASREGARVASGEAPPGP